MRFQIPCSFSLYPRHNEVVFMWMCSSYAQTKGRIGSNLLSRVGEVVDKLQNSLQTKFNSSSSSKAHPSLLPLLYYALVVSYNYVKKRKCRNFEERISQKQDKGNIFITKFPSKAMDCTLNKSTSNASSGFTLPSYNIISCSIWSSQVVAYI